MSDSPTPYRLFIAGSRHATPAMQRKALQAVRRAKEHGWSILVGDNSLGVDAAVVRACDELGVDVTVVGIGRKPRSGGSHRPGSRYIQYQAHGYAQRNRYLAELSDRGLFLWNGISPGTKTAHDYMLTLKKPVHLLTFTPPQRAKR